MDSDDYSYEDDFEIPEASAPQFSSKVSANTSTSAMSRFEYKGFNHRPRYRSHETTKPQSRVDSTRRLGKRTAKSIEKENQELRIRLKNINLELSRIVDFTVSRQSFRPKFNVKPIDIRETNENRLQIYVNEYVLLKEKFEKIMDSEYLIRLKNEIKEKEEKIEEIGKELKKLKKKQANRGKSIGKLYDEDGVSNDGTSFAHLTEKLYGFRNLIEEIEGQQTKDYENYERLYEKEIETNEKIEKLEKVWEFYNNSEEAMRFKSRVEVKERFEKAKKTLEGIKMKNSTTLGKFRSREATLKSEAESIKKETRNTEMLLGHKEKEAQIKRNELEKVMHTVTQNNLGHLLTILNLFPTEISAENTHLAKKATETKPLVEKTPEKIVKKIISREIVKEIPKSIGLHQKIAEEPKKVIEETKKIAEKKTVLSSLDALLGIDPISAKVENNQKNNFLSEKIPYIFEKKPENLGIFEKKPEKPRVNPLDALFETKEPIKTEENDAIKPLFTSKSRTNKRISGSGPTQKENPSPPRVMPSLFQELESIPEKKPELSQFNPNPTKIPEKSSLFMELESGADVKKPSFLLENENSSIFQTELSSKTRDRSHLFIKKEENDLNSLFSASPPKEPLFLHSEISKNPENLPDSLFKDKSENFFLDEKEKRGRKTIEKDVNSFDKLRSMAENAEKQNFFSDFFEKPSVPSQIFPQSKLLPTSTSLFPSNSDSLPSNPIKVPLKPPQLVKNFDLEEEDLIL